MWRTLFHIPSEIAGIPTFGAGLLLAAWCGLSVVLMVWLVRRQGFTADTWGYVPLLALVAAAIWLVLPRLTDARGLPIRGFGLMLLLAVLSAVGLAARRARRLGIEVDLVYTLAFWALVPGILGARLFYVIQKWPEDFAPIYQQQGLGALLGSLANIAQGGIVFYGSLIGGLAGLVAFVIRYRMPLLATFDLLTPSLMLGLAVGRLGCFLNGCCFGGACDLPWAVSFPAASPPHVQEVYRGEAFVFGLKIGDGPQAAAVITDVLPGSPAARQGLAPGQTIASVGSHEVFTADQVRWFLLHAADSNEPVEVAVQSGGEFLIATLTGPAGKSAPAHPTQLYSALNALLLCLFFLAYAPLARRDGELWALLLSIYPVTRFLLEVIRTDEGAVFGTGMTISQNVSLLLLVVAAATWFYVLRKPPVRAFLRASPQTA